MTNLDSIIVKAEEAYGSLLKPNYGFVSKRIEKDLYQKVTREISQSFKVEETTDINNDVAQFFVIDGKWSLAISLVGPYAVFARLGKENQWHILGFTRNDLTSDEQQVIDILATANIFLLDQLTLSQKISFTPVNSAQTTTSLYRVLFEDKEFSEAICRR